MNKTQPPPTDAAYDLIDRYLRNNLDDTDYAEYSTALEAVRVAPAPVGVEPLTEAEANVLWAQCLTKYKRPGPAELIREFCNGGKGGQHAE